jgi:signal transduction histidine kinase
VVLLHEFLAAHRDDIVARTRAKVAQRAGPRATKTELEHGVCLFLDQLAETLRHEQGTRSRGTSAEISRAAAIHGAQLRRAGFTIAQVVHDYGDVCQAVSELAIEQEIPISADELKTLNRCLDEAIAQAVTEFARQRDLAQSGLARDRLGVFAHDLRNLLSSAILAFDVLKTGTVGIGGSTGSVLARSMVGLRDLIDRSLAEVRLEAGLQRREHVSLNELLREVELSAAIEANAHALQFTVIAVAPEVVVDVDRQLLAAALANLLQNAFKFSRPQGHVVVRTDTATAAGRVLIDVEDECGGLPPGREKDLFRPFQQRGADESGVGLGLAIAAESVQTSGGEIRVRNLPDRGCIFTIDLPAPTLASR